MEWELLEGCSNRCSEELEIEDRAGPLRNKMLLYLYHHVSEALISGPFFFFLFLNMYIWLHSLPRCVRHRVTLGAGRSRKELRWPWCGVILRCS